jgi:hypothetical protein
MAALRLLFAPVLVSLIALTLSCGGDDNGAGSSGTPGVLVGTPGTSSRTPADQKSTPAAETATPGTRTEGAVATAPPTAAQGVAAVAPADQEQFVASFLGQQLVEVPCSYKPSTRLTDCAGRGLFAVDPPLAGEDISCALVSIGTNAVAIRCTSQDPLRTLYYEIQRRLN